MSLRAFKEDVMTQGLSIQNNPKNLYKNFSFERPKQGAVVPQETQYSTETKQPKQTVAAQHDRIGNGGLIFHGAKIHFLGKSK